MLRILKNKNKFLFQETQEEKDITKKIHKLTLDTLDSN